MDRLRDNFRENCSVPPLNLSIIYGHRLYPTPVRVDWPYRTEVPRVGALRERIDAESVARSRDFNACFFS